MLTNQKLSPARAVSLSIFAIMAINLPIAQCQAKDAWVWNDTGWGTSTSPTPPVSNPLDIDQSNVVTTATTAKVFAKAKTTNLVPLSISSASATASASTKRIFLWESSCGNPCPNPPTSKSASVSLSGFASTYASKGAVSGGNADSNTSAFVTFAYSDDYAAGGDVNSDVNQWPFKIVSDTALTPPVYSLSSNVSHSYTLSSMLKCSVSFSVTYSVGANATANKSFSNPALAPTATASIEATGSVPQ